LKGPQRTQAVSTEFGVSLSSYSKLGAQRCSKKTFECRPTQCSRRSEAHRHEASDHKHCQGCSLCSTGCAFLGSCGCACCHSIPVVLACLCCRCWRLNATCCLDRCISGTCGETLCGSVISFKSEACAAFRILAHATGRLERTAVGTRAHCSSALFGGRCWCLRCHVCCACWRCTTYCFCCAAVSFVSRVIGECDRCCCGGGTCGIQEGIHDKVNGACFPSRTTIDAQCAVELTA